MLALKNIILSKIYRFSVEHFFLKCDKRVDLDEDVRQAAEGGAVFGTSYTGERWPDNGVRFDKVGAEAATMCCTRRVLNTDTKDRSCTTVK